MVERAKSTEATRLRIVSSNESEEVEQAPLRPGQCREYMRRELAREFRGIVRGFVEGAKSGSCQHVKLATELVATQRPARKRGKSSVRRFLDEIEGRQV